MVRVNIFGVEKCGKCLKTKGRVSNLLKRGDLDKHVEVVYWDQGTFEGRAEGAWYDVDDTLPVTVVENGDHNVARWVGRAPKTEELLVCLESAGAVV